MVFDPTHPIHSGLPESDPVRDNFVALAEHHRGGTAPPNPQIGYIWLDTSNAANWKLKQYTQDAPAAAQWVTLLEHLEANPAALAHASSHTSGADQLPNSDTGDVLRHDGTQWQAVSDHSDFDYLVGPTGKAQFQTVQYAVDQAVIDGHDNDTPARIGIFHGTYTEDITLSAGIFLEAIKIPGYAGYPAAADLVEIVGSITFDHSASTGTWYVVGLRGISVSTSTGVPISFTGTADKRMCIDECYIATSHSTSAVLSLGTSVIDIPCNHSLLSGISGSDPAVVLVADQTLSMFFSAIIGNPSYDSVTIDGGTFYFRGPDSMALGSYLYGKVHVLTGSTGSKVQVYNVRIWVVAGDHFTIDGTVTVGKYEGALDFSAATPVTVGGTNAAAFKELPAADAGEVRQFDGNRWQLVQLSPRVIRTTDDIKAILEAASDGDSFWLEDGTHTTSGIITITSKKNISICGPIGAIVERSDNQSETFRIEGCHDFVMDGFTLRTNIDAGRSTMLDTAVAGVGSYQVPTRHRYSNLHFEQTGAGSCYGFWGNNDMLDSVVEGCTFNGRLYNCITVRAIGPGDKASRVTITNNRCTTTLTSGGMEAIKVESDAGAGVMVDNNTIYGPFTNGIVCSSTDDLTGGSVSGNYIEGCESHSIVVSNSGTWFVNIADNVIYTSGGRGISITGTHISVSDNVIEESGAVGIYVAGSQHDISDNIVDYSTGDGIALVDADGCSVDGNMCYDNTAYGLSLDASSDGNVISGNILNDNADGNLQNLGADNEINGRIENTVQTTGATTPTISTIAIPDDTAVLITVDVVAFRTNGADQVAYKKAALVYRRSAGSATLEGTVQDVITDIESDANFDATISVSGNNAIVTVTGVAVKTMEWKSRHTVQEMG